MYRYAGHCLAALGLLIGRHVVKDEMDAIRGALIDDTVHLLIIDFVDLADLQVVRATINRKPDPCIRRDGRVDAVPAGK